MKDVHRPVFGPCSNLTTPALDGSKAPKEINIRILYITQWFDPEPAVIKGPAFVRALQTAGHQVTVLTGLPNYPTGKIYPGYKFRLFQEEEIEDVLVKRLPLYPSHNRSSVGRALNFISFFVSVLFYGLFRGNRFDIIYVYHPPITVGLAASLFGPFWKVPFILEIQDLWPDTVAESRMRGTMALAGLLKGMCSFVYARAKHIIVQSEAMKSILVNRKVDDRKMSVIRNWADDAAVASPTEDFRGKPAGKAGFTLVYGGNFGRMQALESVIRAARLVAKQDGNFELLLIGDGVESDRLKLLALELEVDNVRFIPRMSKVDVSVIFARADALLIHLADRSLFDVTIPSKTQFYLAMGKPILAGVTGETRDILAESGAAVLAKPENVESLCNAMLEISRLPEEIRDDMGRRGREYYERNLSFDRGMQATLQVISAIHTNIVSNTADEFR